MYIYIYIYIYRADTVMAAEWLILYCFINSQAYILILSYCVCHSLA